MFGTGRESRDRADPQCRNCGATVSTKFALVFGDNDNRVFGCHECMSKTELYDGGSVQGE